jgi:predicted GIY-YIG superfamily endonuclease
MDVILRDGFYDYTKKITQAEVGKLILFVKNINSENNIIGDTYRFMKVSKITDESSFKKFVKKMKDSNILYEEIRKKGSREIIVNPRVIISKDFNFNIGVIKAFKDEILNDWKFFKNYSLTKDIFDYMSIDLFEKLHELEYLKIKSNWYEVSHQIAINDFYEMQNYISGIYRLYSKDTMIYIGKSKCIKNRIKQHIKEKNIDKFDFTIINNDSDKNIIEVYLIDKYKPILNKDCLEVSDSSIKIEEPVFSNLIKLN